MRNFETVVYEKIHNVAYVTLNRPQVLNVYNTQMRDELYQVLGAIKDDSEVMVAVFRGTGKKAFCAGADLSEFLTAPSPTIARGIRWGRDVWELFLSLPQPLIAALHGYVFGSGIEMALCCDIRIASDDALFGLPEVGLGIIPAAGATQTLPRTIGQAKALEMMFTGHRISAKQAFEMKLVNRVVPRARLLPTVKGIARQITRFDPMVIRSAKQAVIRGLDLTLLEGLELEKRLARSLLRSKIRNSSG
ncbi:MAG: enoyl-CoA hydratase/isomerase family protein [Dehalococcoidia bacterium]|nr:enoyl-CoA hydratase/isomerase family protein [Dehalococcoidia bacterium]